MYYPQKKQDQKILNVLKRFKILEKINQKGSGNSQQTSLLKAVSYIKRYMTLPNTKWALKVESSYTLKGKRSFGSFC